MLYTMIEVRMRRKISLLLGSILLLVFAAFAFAQEGGGITVAPVKFEEKVDLGETIDLTIKVTNADEGILYAFPVDFTADPDESGYPKFVPKEERSETYSLASWLKVSQTTLSFKQGETKRVKVSIEIPQNAEPGGHYGAVIFSSEPLGVTEGVAVGVQVGTLILVEVPGAVEEKGRLIEFSASKTRYENPPVDLFTRFENLGDIHLKPSGVIEIFNWRNRKEDTLQVNPTFGNVLPQSIRKFENSWDPQTRLFPKMGRYKAKLLLTFGSAGQTETDEILFWIIPFLFLGKMAVGAVIGLVLVIFAIKRYNRWVVERAAKEGERRES